MIFKDADLLVRVANNCSLLKTPKAVRRAVYARLTDVLTVFLDYAQDVLTVEIINRASGRSFRREGFSHAEQISYNYKEKAWEIPDDRLAEVLEVMTAEVTDFLYNFADPEVGGD